MLYWSCLILFFYYYTIGLPHPVKSFSMSFTRFWWHQVISLPTKLVTYLHLQLVLSLCAWPIFYYWGLPLSPALLVGNLLFSPLLIATLLLSSGIFFTTLLHLPSGPLPFLLELITSCWWFILSQGSPTWLCVLAHPPQVYIILTPPLTYILLLIKPLSPKIRIYLFLLIFSVLGCVIPRCKGYGIARLPYKDKELTLLYYQTTGILIDDGTFGQRSSARSLITYQVVPYLYKHGITTLQTIVICKPSVQAYKTATLLIEAFPVQQIYLSVFSARFTNSGWHSWEELLRVAQQHHTEIYLVKKNQHITMGPERLAIEVLPKPIRKNNCYYRPLVVPSTANS